jgi:U3 small nucleolar RNA-associated protein 10
MLTNSQSLGKAEQAVADLTVLLESRDWKSMSGDAPLVATLMSVLSALLAKRQHVKEGVDYLEQEILGAILTLVEKIQNTEEIQKAHIGVEVIIKVIRGKSTDSRGDESDV